MPTAEEEIISIAKELVKAGFVAGAKGAATGLGDAWQDITGTGYHKETYENRNNKGEHMMLPNTGFVELSKNGKGDCVWEGNNQQVVHLWMDDDGEVCICGVAAVVVHSKNGKGNLFIFNARGVVVQRWDGDGHILVQDCKVTTHRKDGNGNLYYQGNSKPDNKEWKGLGQCIQYETSKQPLLRNWQLKK